MSCSTSAGRVSCAGFSLAEVVVALGLLAGVLISTAGLLVLGGRMVSRGRNSSEALAAGRVILEKIDGWSFERTYRQFDCDPAESICTVDTLGIASQPWQLPPAETWHSLLGSGLPDGRAQIRLEALGGPSLAASRAIRVRVTVFWSEGLRQRSLPLATVRF